MYNMHQLKDTLKNPLLLRRWMLVTLTTLFFFIPIGITGKAICLGLVVVPMIILPTYYQSLMSIIREPWCKTLFIFIILVIIGCLWSPATARDKISILKKYDKLLYLPFLVVAFKTSRAQKPALIAFIISMTIVCCLSILQYFKVTDYFNPTTADPGEVFFNHIITALMMAFAAYVSAVFFFKEKGNLRFAFGLLTMLFSYQILFINSGRMGYLFYLLLMLLLIVQFFSWKKALFSSMIAGLMMIFIFFNSSIMQHRVMEVIHDVHLFVHNQKNTSIGYRIQFHQYAYYLLKKHPILGNGTASLTANFHQDHPISTWNSSLFQPHNQYLFIAVENGLLGLAIYCSFLIFLLIEMFQLSTLRPVGLGITAIFVVGSITESLLYNSGAGYFFIVMIALSLSESKNKTEPLLSSETVLADGRLRQAQLKMLGMLQAVDAICKKHGLDYWLDAGTLLGAVRHQGFIPWDDDMDIGMTRASYEAFLRIAPTELPNHIWLQTSETDKGYYNLGAPLKIRDKNSYYLEKHETGNEPYVQGIFIDVFVYDKMPTDPKLRQRYKLIAKKLLRILSTKYSKVPMGHYAILYRIIGAFFPKTLLNYLLQRIIDQSNRLDTPYLGRGYQCKMSNLIHYDDLYPLKKAFFESGEFNVFNKTEQFLREQYGDYMTPPPETHRGMRHCKALVPDL